MGSPKRTTLLPFILIPNIRHRDRISRRNVSIWYFSQSKYGTTKTLFPLAKHDTPSKAFPLQCAWRRKWHDARKCRILHQPIHEGKLDLTRCIVHRFLSSLVPSRVREPCTTVLKFHLSKLLNSSADLRRLSRFLRFLLRITVCQNPHQGHTALWPFKDGAEARKLENRIEALLSGLYEIVLQNIAIHVYFFKNRYSYFCRACNSIALHLYTAIYFSFFFCAME